MQRDIYLNTILPHVPRILGMIDRDPNSPTYGCADRNYWHYKLIDTPSARFQEVCLTLSLLYSINHSSNPYFHQEKIKSWTLAVVKFWQSIQKGDGSFDEWYPQEKSFVATTFSLYCVTEGLMMLNIKNKKYDQSIRKAAHWLMCQTEFTVCNQHAGSCIALWNCFEITGDHAYKIGAEEKWQILKTKQTKEGWFPEYGGADVGYSSVLLDYLGKYYQKSKNEEVLETMKRLCHFLVTCIHPNNSSGGEYGSRNTEYLLSHGLEIFSDKIPEASFLANQQLFFLKNNYLNLDDRYLINNGYTFLQAFIDFNPKKQNFTSKLGAFWYPESGLFIFNNRYYYFIANLKKGVARKIYGKQTMRLEHEHSGIIVELVNGDQLTSQYLHQQTKIKIDSKLHTVKTVSPLFVVKRVQMSALTLISSRFFQLSFGRIQFISHLAKKILRILLITGSKSSTLSLQQEIIFLPHKVIIRSILHNPMRQKIKTIRMNDKFSLVYIPSSRYFQQQEFNTSNGKSIDVEKVNTCGITTVTDIYSF